MAYRFRKWGMFPYPNCKRCISEREAIATAWTEILLARLTSDQIASALEQWEAVCSERGWMPGLDLWQPEQP